ncbi:MAG: T9SS type A sorting domain-containing protein [Flavobacteriales bacterium]|nr:T9SS type A sorting domain-containing protein [Flavobacteriales bacterium]
MRDKYIYIFLIFCLCKTAFAQVAILPLEEENPEIPELVFNSAQKDILTLHTHSGIGVGDATLVLKKWNGLFWADFPSVEVSQFKKTDENRFSVCKFNNFPVIAGSFGGKGDPLSGIIQFDGTKWVTIGGGIESDFVIHNDISINSLQPYKGELFVSGKFNIANGKKVKDFVVLRSGVWEGLQFGGSRVNEMTVKNDTLFAVGLFSSVEGVGSNNLIAYTNGNWVSVSSFIPDEILRISSYNNQLVAFTGNDIYLQNNGPWTALKTNWKWKIEELGGFCEYNGKLFISGIFTESGLLKSHLLSWDGLKWESLIDETDIQIEGDEPLTVGVVKNEILLSGNFRYLKGLKTRYHARIFEDKALVKGKIFIDQNKDCMFTPGEKIIEGAILQNDNGYYTSSDIKGDYYFAIDRGKASTVRFFSNEYYSIACSQNQATIDPQNTDSIIILDFPMMLNDGSELPEIDLFASKGNKARHGYKNRYYVRCIGKNALFPIKLTLDFNRNLIFDNTSIQPILNTKGKMTWIIKKPEEFYIDFIVDHNWFNSGDSLYFSLMGSSDNSEFSKLKRELKQVIVSAYDPNEKLCDKEEIGLNEKQLNYHIEFQNLGNDSAVRIHVVDTISKTIPIQYLKVLGYKESHRGLVSFKVRDHAIIWTFEDIFLPSKKQAGDDLSSGYINYKVSLDDGLTEGQLVKNKAFIYFDFQDPVETNEVVTKVVKKEAIHTPGNDANNLRVFPNPLSEDQLFIELLNNPILQVEIHDLLGRRFYDQKFDKVTYQTQIDLSKLHKGMYIVSVRNPVGITSRKLTIDR